MSLRLPLLPQRVDRPSEDPLVADHQGNVQRLLEASNWRLGFEWL
jgi:hypothetical protein